MAAANHRKRCGGVEKGGARPGSYRNAAGVGYFGVFSGVGIMTADSEQTVLGVKNDFDFMRDVVGNFSRQSDTESDDVSLLKFLSYSLGNDRAALFF